MLDEYILEQLSRLSEKKDALSKELKALSSEENDENEKITKLLTVDDVGKELFSPRGSNEPLKIQVNQIKSKVNDLLLRQAKVQDQLEILTQEEEKYRQMLFEARSREKTEPEEENNPDKMHLGIQNEIRQFQRDTRAKEELEVVLKKVEQCIDYSLTDKAKCTAELTNLRYYIKALLSQVE